MRPVRNTLPVNLIADGRPALVVGYGKVGQRKERFLRACGLGVTVISPDAETSAASEDGAVRFVRRAFRAGDCKGALAVFACTDDKHVNQAVLADARAHGVPCCCSDMNWAEGDFTTPAIVRVADAVVAVSTNGASCTNAKALRQEIGEFLGSRTEGRIIVLGTNDKMLATDRRAAYHLPPPARREMLRFLYGLKGVEGVVVLNTCNRVEVVLQGDVDLDLAKRLMRFHRLAENEYFVREGDAAFRHLVKVTAGLESAWAGEFHVVSQVKEALDEALSAHVLNGRLKGFFDDVLRVSKDVRHAVEGLLAVKEIEATAVDYLAARLDLAVAHVVVLGSGQIGAGVAERLKGGHVTVVHHGDEIPPCDAVVCALAAPAPVLTARVEGRIVLDLGMPPNCAPEVGAVSLDDLKNWRRAETGALDEALARAEAVIERALAERKENGR